MPEKIIPSKPHICVGNQISLKISNLRPSKKMGKIAPHFCAGRDLVLARKGLNRFKVI
jgi:hypothetical protein